MKDDWADLAARAREGDAGAFEELVDRFEVPLCATIHAVLGDWHLTQDVAQETFVAAWKGLGDLRHPGHFRKWIFRIARNRAVSRLRGSARARTRRLVPELEEQVAAARAATDGAGAPGSPEAFARGRALARVRQAVLELPNDYGPALLMHHVEGMTLSQMAEALKRSRKAVKSLLHRARARAREKLSRAGLDRERVLDEE